MCKVKAYIKLILILVSLRFLPDALAQEKGNNRLSQEVYRCVSDVEAKVINWRRDIHQHPELSNQEFRTAQLVAAHLRTLGVEVKTEIAHTGVVGILNGNKKGFVVALRADMDALPVTEALDLPFASKVKTNYNGQEVGVMHACGHDAHVAILMGVAEVLSAMKDKLTGTVKFIFQPAEESGPEVEAGARLMIREGVLESPKPNVIFGLHVGPYPSGTIWYRSGSAMASGDVFRIVVHGRQTHGANPWAGIDPIVVASQIVLGLQNIVSRQINITEAPAIISIGSIHGGVRANIIPGEVEILGTIRAFDPKMRIDIHERIRNTATLIAQSVGATADVTITLGYPVTMNDPSLTERMIPVLEKAAGKEKTFPGPLLTNSEDFAYYQQQIPGLFFQLGIVPNDQDWTKAAPNHSPSFYIDENALIVGVRALSLLAIEYLKIGEYYFQK